MITPRPSHPSRFTNTRRNHRTSVLACLAAMVLLPALPAAARADLHPHERDGWFLGLGFGGGGVAIETNGATSERESGATGHLRAGYILTPRVAIGFEGNFWFKTIEGVDWTFDTYTAAVTVYPGGGFTLRGGIGGGGAEAAISSGNTTTTASETGLGFSTGVGYEIRVARKWAIVPQVDYSFVNLDNFDANFGSFSIAAHWYLLPSK